MSVQTSVVGVQYCTGSYMSVNPVDTLGKRLSVRLYSARHFRGVWSLCVSQEELWLSTLQT